MPFCATTGTGERDAAAGAGFASGCFGTGAAGAIAFFGGDVGLLVGRGAAGFAIDAAGLALCDAFGEGGAAFVLIVVVVSPVARCMAGTLVVAGETLATARPPLGARPFAGAVFAATVWGCSVLATTARPTVGERFAFDGAAFVDIDGGAATSGRLVSDVAWTTRSERHSAITTVTGLLTVAVTTGAARGRSSDLPAGRTT